MVNAGKGAFGHLVIVIYIFLTLLPFFLILFPNLFIASIPLLEHIAHFAQSVLEPKNNL